MASEGRPVFEATAKVLRLREAPSSSSRITHNVKVSLKERLTFDSSRYRTIRSARITANVLTLVRGRMLGAINHLSTDDYYRGKFPEVELEIKPGMSFEYLQYRAEGTCFLRVSGKVIDSFCPAESSRLKPKTEWWIHLPFSRGISGWLLVDESTVKEVAEIKEQPNTGMQPAAQKTRRG